MADPIDVDTDTTFVTNAADTDITQHADAADAGLTPTSIPIATSGGLQSSPLNKLPPEIRNTIWEMVVDTPKGLNMDPRIRTPYTGHAAPTTNPQIAWALNLMATCRQIRSETKGLLLDLNDINIYIDKVRLRDQELNIQQSIQQSIPELERIPSSLGRELGRVVVCVEDSLLQYRQGLVKEVFKIPGLPQALTEFAHAIHPFRLLLGLDFRFALWDNGDKQVCKRDVPLTFDDCTAIQCNIPLGDRAVALRAVDETIDRRLRLLRRHDAHRMCAVRAMRRTLVSGLEVTRQYMQKIIDLVLEAPEAVGNVAGADTTLNP